MEKQLAVAFGPFRRTIEVCHLTAHPYTPSRIWKNLWAAYCLHFAYYNFCRIHKTLRVTPAMESNLTDHVRDMAELPA